MAVDTKVSADQSTVTISISGQFNAAIQREFRDAYKDRASPVNKATYIVDLARAEYMDSAALGMLLLLREYVGGDKKNVVIKNPNTFIGDILKIAKFDTLFTITN